MTNTTNGHPPAPARTSLFRAAPLPEPPDVPSSWPDRASRLKDQASALNTLIREDLSRGRALVFLLCAALVTLVAGLVPAMVIDAADSEPDNSTDVAVAVVLGVVMLAVLAVPALFVLRAFRKRSTKRFELLTKWAAVDRSHDSDFPTRYGTRGYPHGRFFYGAVVLALVLILGAALLSDLSDPTALGLLPSLVVAGLFSWGPVRKYAQRYSWSEHERVIRARARRRELHRTHLAQSTASGSPTTYLAGTRIHPILLYAALFGPAVIVTLVFVVARPKNALGLVLAGLVALAILVIGLPKVLLMRRRERAELDSATSSLASAFTNGTMTHPVRYGLGESDSRTAVTSTASSWDHGPSRTGVLAVDSGVLRLRGMDGATLDLPITDVQGAVYFSSGVAWVPASVDVLLRSGEAIEFRSPAARAITDALVGNGVPVTTA
ncbi:hypothetical protein [Streptomyces justiciae]|uniref:hypothetical protein n=1 Tax=Streptomyces justiciae TaxID=2780140 RepID=UPI0021188785|nr:hypothetical protein [Streptomyces justiciae]MCW8379533.1 hypothetical protein [Streptomyces justiciae]